MHEHRSKNLLDSHPRPSRPLLYSNNDSHSFHFENQKTFLHPGDRVTAAIFNDLITGTVQLPDPEALVGAEVRGAEFAYYRDRVWRVEFLADDGQLICCHRDLCHPAGGAV